MLWETEKPVMFYEKHLTEFPEICRKKAFLFVQLKAQTRTHIPNLVLEERTREAWGSKDKLRSWERPGVEPTMVPGKEGEGCAMKPKLVSPPPFKNDAELSRDALLIEKRKKFFASMPKSYINIIHGQINEKEKVIRNQKWDNFAVDMSDGEK